ncbi:MAG: acyl-CoA dehydrogenase family protein [Actinomycetota bacterium]|nr:acyl-CoA dehydrogenase family protein [Actinomycetota bacterium]
MPYMDLNLSVSKVQKINRDMVRTFAHDVLRPASLELDKLGPEDVIDKESIFWDIFRKGYKIGLHKILIPDIYGGGGFSPLEVHMLFEEISWGSVDFVVAFGVACFPAFIASLVPTEFLVDNIIVPFCEDEEAKIIGCWAITEPDHGSDTLGPFTEQFSDPEIAKTACRATLDGDEWVINGTKAAWVSCGTIATHATTYLTIDPEMGMAGGGICVIPLDLPGCSRGKPLDKLGQRALNQGEIYFDNVRVPKDYMLIEQDSYEAMLDVTLSTANASMGAFFTGVAQAAYEEALGYCKERVQGGKKLIDHQLVRYKLFHMFKQVEAARAFSRAVMDFNFSTNPPFTHYSIASKIFCTEAAMNVAHEAVQLCGGFGLTKESTVEKLYRDARAGMIEDGSNDYLALVAGEVLVQED